ncbi:hypothetical protein Mapa_000157 [Marchantia paleacea]|nr:hypothetical protein Mapa_000157 [Marchantia paleacea]
MAGQPSASAPVPAAAHVVGNAFVNQYYHILHNTPDVVHRFYTDDSRLTRAEAGADGAVETFCSQREIDEKVMSLDYGDVKAEIFTVDSQDSFSGGVLVMVTGSLSSKTIGKRNFVQSFFLAPQVKGYYVLNDIFRYLDEEPVTSKSLPVLANGIPEPTPIHNAVEPEPTLAADHEARDEPSPPPSEVEIDEIFDMPEQHVEVSEAEEDAGLEELTHVETTPVIDEPPSPMAEPAAVAPPMEETSGEAPKKSYASILRHQTAGTSLSSPTYNAVPKAATPAPDRPAVSPGYQPGPAVALSGQESLEEGLPIENEVDGRSVYVKNLPIIVTPSQLEEEFSKFGLIKPGGVNVKSQKLGVCYAFVEFEDAASAASAIESSPITLGMRQVYIEEKRHMGPRGAGGRGRAPMGGRGDRPFRSDGLRGGRGDRGFQGGRGGGVGGGRGQDRDISNRGRGTGPARGGSGNYGGANNNGGNGGAGANASGAENHRPSGNANRPPRRGGNNQMSRNGAVSRGSTPVAAA